MHRAAILTTLALTGLTLACLGRQPEEMAIQKLRDNLFLITGNGGNSAVFVRAAGVVLVDTKIAGSGQRLAELIRTVTDKPITHIINTHSHFDHAGSNAYFPAVVEVVAHENAAGLMTGMEEFDEAPEKHGLPDRTFRDMLTLFADDEAIDLYHFGAAHTRGDAFVVFRAARVMHAGDTFPGMNAVTRDGGSEAAYPTTMGRAATIKGIETVIPGHGALASWQEFVSDVRALGR